MEALTTSKPGRGEELAFAVAPASGPPGQTGPVSGQAPRCKLKNAGALANSGSPVLGAAGEDMEERILESPQLTETETSSSTDDEASPAQLSEPVVNARLGKRRRPAAPGASEEAKRTRGPQQQTLQQVWAASAAVRSAMEADHRNRVVLAEGAGAGDAASPEVPCHLAGPGNRDEPAMDAKRPGAVKAGAVEPMDVAPEAHPNPDLPLARTLFSDRPPRHAAAPRPVPADSLLAACLAAPGTCGALFARVLPRDVPLAPLLEALLRRVVEMERGLHDLALAEGARQDAAALAALAALAPAPVMSPEGPMMSPEAALVPDFFASPNPCGNLDEQYLQDAVLNADLRPEMQALLTPSLRQRRVRRRSRRVTFATFDAANVETPVLSREQSEQPTMALLAHLVDVEAAGRTVLDALAIEATEAASGGEGAEESETGAGLRSQLGKLVAILDQAGAKRGAAEARRSKEEAGEAAAARLYASVLRALLAGPAAWDEGFVVRRVVEVASSLLRFELKRLLNCCSCGRMAEEEDEEDPASAEVSAPAPEHADAYAACVTCAPRSSGGAAAAWLQGVGEQADAAQAELCCGVAVADETGSQEFNVEDPAALFHHALLQAWPFWGFTAEGAEPAAAPVGLELGHLATVLENPAGHQVDFLTAAQRFVAAHGFLARVLAHPVVVAAVRGGRWRRVEALASLYARVGASGATGLAALADMSHFGSSILAESELDAQERVAQLAPRRLQEALRRQARVTAGSRGKRRRFFRERPLMVGRSALPKLAYPNVRRIPHSALALHAVAEAQSA